MEGTTHASDGPTPVHAANDNNPAALVTAAVAGALELARTWLGWDGRPRVDREGGRV
jgi:hypothetical protein